MPNSRSSRDRPAEIEITRLNLVIIDVYISLEFMSLTYLTDNLCFFPYLYRLHNKLLLYVHISMETIIGQPQYIVVLVDFRMCFQLQAAKSIVYSFS